jgi:hypothetical protein
VNHLRNQRGNEETQTLPDNAQNVENFEVASGNHSNGNNFDRIATLINPPTGRLLRRPITRAAGYDSRQPMTVANNLNSSSNQQTSNNNLFQLPLPSPNASSNQTHAMNNFERLGQSQEQILPRSPISVQNLNAQSEEQQRADEPRQARSNEQEPVETNAVSGNDNQRERRARRDRNLQYLLRTQMPRFDDNFLSRSETQIQN